MGRTLNDLEEILRSQICSMCPERREDGTCGLEQPADCAVFRLLPEVAVAIQSIDSDDTQDYVRAIREKVCVICSAQAADGTCKLRTQMQCALDAYFHNHLVPRSRGA